MSIRIKMLGLICGTLIILIMALYAFSQIILLQDYENLEETTVKRNVEVALSAVEDKVAFFHNTGMDWAHWDDTYAYIHGLDDTYIAENILNSVFEYYDLNFVLFVNPAGEIIYSQGYDADQQNQVPVSESLSQFVSHNESLLRPRDAKTGNILKSGVSGIVLLPGLNLIIAATPILPSNLEGDPSGALVWGRYLNEAFVDQLASQTRLTLSISRITPDVLVAASDTVDASITLQRINNDLIVGSIPLNDINGTPALMLKVDMPRNIHQQGQNSISYFLFSLLLFGGILTAAVAFILEREVLSRIAYLSHHVSQIQVTRDMSSRVRVVGNDELTKLSANINLMLENLQAQEQIKLAHDKAIEVARLKAEILANVSHDARTPLSVIMLRTQMLMKEMYGPVSLKQREILNIITTNSHKLLDFINNMLEGARLENGHLTLAIAEVEPVKLLETVKLTLQPLAALKNLSLKTELSDEVPKILWGDQNRLERILTNLVSNAIKFTEHGTVEVKICRTDLTHWGFEVRDTGAGISPEHQQQIFTPFWQVDGSTIRSANSGVGLGLSIVHQLTELMGGTITVNSTLNQGSVFTVILPLELPVREI